MSADNKIAVFRRGNRRIFVVDIPDEEVEDFIKRFKADMEEQPNPRFIKPKGKK